MSRTRRSLRMFMHAALVPTSLAATVLVSEIVLQIGVRALKPRFTKVHPVLGWSHNPGVTGLVTTNGESSAHRVSYNSLGFRVPERSIARTGERPRIVVIGDSFVDGSEVGDEENFVWLLDRSLTEIEVINLGVYGFHTTQQYLTLSTVGMQFKPDAAVLMVFSNDLPGNVVSIESFGPAPRFVLDGDSLRFEGMDHPATRESFRAYNLPVPEWVRRHSLLYWAVNHYIYHRLAQDKIQSFIAAREATASPSERNELLRRIVGKMQALCDAHEVNFLVVFGYVREEIMEHVTSPLSEVIALIQQDGTEVLDLFDSLRAAETSHDRSLYFEQDMHWNSRGHRAVAGMLETPFRELALRRSVSFATQ